LWLQLFHFQHFIFRKCYNPKSMGLGEIWSIESYEGFNVGFCGSRSIEDFDLYLIKFKSH